MSRIFALVDCNNFYASCEKLFRPDLKNVPIVVLSNNDGCVVARSKEAKALGIKMAVPVFQIQEQIEQHGILLFSSNYALYADLSCRVMTILEGLAPKVEVYSIDEAFLDLSGLGSAVSLLEFGQNIKETVAQWVGLSVCVGIAPLKRWQSSLTMQQRNTPPQVVLLISRNGSDSSGCWRLHPLLMFGGWAAGLASALT